MLNTLFISLIVLSIVLFSPKLLAKLKPGLQSQLWVLWLFVIFFISISFVGIEVSLFWAMIFTALFYAYDWFCLSRKTKTGPKKLMFHLVDFFPVLLVIWLIRSFLLQPYHVPTGSLEPTVRPGDFLLVNQYYYGVRMPIWRHKLLDVGEPKRGDIVVFFPPNGPVHFVKRLIGLPGDVIKYKQKTIYVNGVEMQQELVGPGYAEDPGAAVLEKQEQLAKVSHKIFINPMMPEVPEHTWIVPKGHYFMMGDNRDFSGDSREFGFVPERNIVGRPMFIWLSVNMKAFYSHDWANVIRWHRIGKKVS